jgi:hypothetical protein
MRVKIILYFNKYSNFSDNNVELKEWEGGHKYIINYYILLVDIWFDLIYLLLSKNRQCYLSNTLVVHTVQYISITLLNDKKKVENNNYSK